MDLDDFRVILSRAKADVWAVIETAIAVAAEDHGEELKHRRDKIVQMLYSTAAAGQQRCGNCSAKSGDDVVVANDDNNNNLFKSNYNKSPLTPESDHRNSENEYQNNKSGYVNDDDEEDLDPYGGLFDDQKTEILKIRDRLQDPDQVEDEHMVELLQTLADMEITFSVLQETEIGRLVSRLKKHPSYEVRKLVKQLVAKWKETVDDWVRLKEPEKASSNLIADGDSPQQQQNIPKSQHNGNHHQVPDFGYSPNPQNGGSSSDRNHSTPEHRAKSVSSQREAPSRPLQSASKSASAPPPTRPPKETDIDEKLDLARKRLHENYQEAENVKKQKKIQVLEEIPKGKNAFMARNKGGFQRRHHR